MTAAETHDRVTVGQVGFDHPGPRTEYDDVEIGREYGPAEWVASPEMLDTYLVSTSEYHEWYVNDSPYGGRIIPMWLTYRVPRHLFSGMYNVRGLAYHFECENLAPIRPNEKYLVTVRMVDKWQARGRGYVKYEAIFTDSSGQAVLTTRRTHAMDVVDSAGAVNAKKMEGAPPREERAPAYRVTEETEVGQELTPFAFEQPLSAMIAFMLPSEISPRNIHTDYDAAEREGLPAPVGVGPHFGTTVSQMMMAAFSEGWVVGGRISLKFISPTFAGDTLTAKGTVQSKEREGAQTRVSCEVWIENQHGTKVAVGQASGLV